GLVKAQLKIKKNKKIIEDPKKLLDLFRVFHRLIHIYEIQENLKEKSNQPNKPNEKMGLNDSLNIQVFSNKSKEVKK
ncbi:MAG: hypothetical protein ACOC5T_09970, partial [Elusimicrobiota bacterium]